MRCVLHIGTEKTGTTLLQSWLYLNLKNLKKQGVYLSKELGRPNNRLFPAYFRSSLDDWAKANKINSVDEKNQYFKNFEKELAQEICIASKNCDLFIITSEHLHSRLTNIKDIENVRDYLKGKFNRVEVVCYFRNQADMAISSYSTAIKAARSGSLEEFIEWSVKPENYYYNFLQIADAWSSVFGRKNCTFRIYDRNMFVGNDIRLDFLDAASATVDQSKLDFGITEENRSLQRLIAVVFSNINSLVPYFDQQNGCVNQLNLALKKEISPISSLRRGAINTTKKSELLNMFESSNRILFEKYFNDEQGFELPVNEKPENDTFSIEEVEVIVDDISKALLRFTSWDGMGKLRDGDAECLKDIALRIEQGGELGLKDALALMTLAGRARPQETSIEKKTREYRDRLSKA